MEAGPIDWNFQKRKVSIDVQSDRLNTQSKSMPMALRIIVK